MCVSLRQWNKLHIWNGISQKNVIAVAVNQSHDAFFLEAVLNWFVYIWFSDTRSVDIETEWEKYPLDGTVCINIWRW